MVNLSEKKRENLSEKLTCVKNKLGDDTLESYLNELESVLFKKKFGLVWEEHSEEVYDKLTGYIPIFKEIRSKEFISNNGEDFNFILEGDNLHCLKLLEKTHKNKIDVIYIDPPYNTGSKDWKYNNDFVDENDNFRHSKWLSLMYNRLVIAKKLLVEEGVLICAIDKNEQATLMLLLEDIFGYNYNFDCITIVHNPRGVQGNNFSYTHEYAIFVYKKGTNPIQPRIIEESEIDWRDLRDNGHESLREDAASCFYSINIKDGKIIGFGPNRTQDENFHPKKNEPNEDGSISIYPVDKEGIERKWRYSVDSVPDIVDRLRIKCVTDVDGNDAYDIQLGKNTGKYKTVWIDKKFDSNEYGTKLINNMVPGNDFNYPKSIYNTYECLNAVVRNNPNAIILDFFAGSGTTAHAVSLLNKMDGGNRKFILATNNDIGDKKEKEFKKEIGDPEEFNEKWEEWKETYGIASSITYPRVKAINDGFIHKSKFKEPLYVKKINMTQFKRADKILEEIEKIKEQNKDVYNEFKVVFEENHIKLLGIYDKGEKIQGIPFNLKYYKTDFIEKTYDGSVSWRLLEHISELIQLQYHLDINDESVKLILSEEELDSLSEESLTDCQIVFVPSDVFLTSEEEMLIKNSDVTMIRIPKYYFNEELREVGEL